MPCVPSKYRGDDLPPWLHPLQKNYRPPCSPTVRPGTTKDQAISIQRANNRRTVGIFTLHAAPGRFALTRDHVRRWLCIRTIISHKAGGTGRSIFSDLLQMGPRSGKFAPSKPYSNPRAGCSQWMKGQLSPTFQDR